jgi:hypothetical protein
MELPATSITYRGPVIPADARGDLDVHTQLVAFTGTLGSSGAGAISSYLVNDISASSDWAGFAAIYKEYRILAQKVEYLPHNRYSKTTTVCAPFTVAIDHSGSTTTPVSHQELIQYSSARKKSIEDPWSMTAKMSGTEEAQYLPTTTTTPRYGFKIFADSLSASTTYGRYYFYWLVQFRGRF